MSRLRVAPIVEGDGEVAALPVLIRRLWQQFGGDYVDVFRPIRRNRNEFEDKNRLLRAVGLAVSKLKADPSNDPGIVLILFDCDPSREPPCKLGPQAINWVEAASRPFEVACVVANVEYETWFVAAAESLPAYIRLNPGESVPVLPESQRCGKKWVQTRFLAPRYAETKHQPALTATMDLALCRTRSPSFDKLCRELERRIAISKGGNDGLNSV